MKVILIEDVENIGKAGDLVDVKIGYFRNFLEPQGLAVRGTKANLKNWKEEQKKRAEIKAENIALAEELKEKIEATKITITSKSGENGKLFGSITNQDIATKLNEQENLSIDKKKVEMAENIKEIGEYTVKIRVFPEMTADLKVEIINE